MIEEEGGRRGRGDEVFEKIIIRYEIILYEMCEVPLIRSTCDDLNIYIYNKRGLLK